MVFNFIKSLLGGSHTEPQKPESLERLETSLNDIKTLLPSLQKESFETNKAFVELLQLKIEQMDFRNPILSNGSIENSQKLDILENYRQSLAIEPSLTLEGLAVNDLLQYQTLKKEFFLLVDKAHLYVEKIADARTSCTAFYDYVKTTVELKGLKVHVSSINEATITKGHEQWMHFFTVTKKTTREILQAERIQPIQQLISLHKNDLLYKQLASRVEEINTLNESLYTEILELADQKQAQLFPQIQTLPNAELGSHKLESLTGFEPNLLESGSTSTFHTTTLSPKIKSAIKTSFTQKKEIAWSKPESSQVYELMKGKWVLAKFTRMGFVLPPEEQYSELCSVPLISVANFFTSVGKSD